MDVLVFELDEFSVLPKDDGPIFGPVLVGVPRRVRVRPWVSVLDMTKNGRDLPNPEANKKRMEKQAVSLLQIRREFWAGVRLRPPNIVRIER
jgi:hypothetical protein